MSHFIETGAPVVGFCLHNDRCFLLCGNDLIQADAKTGRIERQKKVFRKDGKSRLIRTNGKVLAVSDFCTLSVFDADTLDERFVLKLGNDLTDDICGLAADESFLYACIRNGGLTRIATADFSQSSAVIGTASSWSLAVWEDKLYAGTVDGKLLRIDRQTLKTEAVLSLSRQNVKSLYRSGGTLYAAGQDKMLYVIDLPTFSLVRKASNVHPMMFDIIGEKDGVLYTVSHPACEISGWDKRGAKVCSIPYRLRLSGSSCIFGDTILVSSRNINGVDRIELSDVNDESYAV